MNCAPHDGPRAHSANRAACLPLFGREREETPCPLQRHRRSWGLSLQTEQLWEVASRFGEPNGWVARNMMKTLSSLAWTARSLVLRQCYALQNAVSRLDPRAAAYTQFHSQFGEDRYVYHHLGLPVKGVFVDVGAGHPRQFSNTYFFERNGWQGLCVDADPVHCALLREERATVEWAAVGLQEGEIEFAQAYSAAFSSVLQTDKTRSRLKVPSRAIIRVPAHRLEALLQKHEIGEIDLLSIDVEGMEGDVWRSFDPELHKPKVVIVEYYTFGLGNEADQLKALFAQHPYRLVRTTCANLIYVRCGPDRVRSGSNP